jgi:hypothetical protein
MTNEEVMEICVTNSDPLKAAGAIVDVASDRWEQRDADHRRDDITVMILRTEIEKSPPSVAATSADEGAAAPATATTTTTTTTEQQQQS